ncbi:MAG: hypothetical protein ACRYFX_22105 [Janthinobacterium lividum]
MKRFLLATPLLATTLLLGTSNCSKKEDATPAVASNTGSYKLDGQLVSCKATGYEYLHTSTQSHDSLQLELSTPGNANGMYDDLIVKFAKTAGSAASTYQVTAVGYSKGHGGPVLQPISFPKDQKYTITRTAGGGYSGTFSGTNPVTSSTITEGIFTDVHP